MLKQFRILWISLSLLAAFLIAACDSPTGPADPGEPDTPMEQPVPEPAPTPAPAAPKPAPAPAPKPQAAAPVPAPVCADCGSVSSIEPVTEKGAGSGGGALAGAVVGGVVGHQFGGGKGKDLATVAGAIGGAMAGHEVEKRVRSTSYYRVTVAMEAGGTRVVEVTDPAGLSVGSKVRIVGENLQLM
ncbi:MAG: glycine zipper 2TM domain-containing protein [Gammaproteobacteria bacterium]|nr:glycine zipper 2TM domain-containing protein [Gammaproteobacteria bacterium]